MSYATFDPDLIVEVTTVCDRACPGCYSPTLRSKEAPAIVFARHPEMFLAPRVLEQALDDLAETDLVIALRGGEPSRHPLLGDVVRVARRRARVVYVETHARWIVDGPLDSLDGAIAKISFDDMHGMRRAMLRDVTDRLDRARAPWVVAITEPDEAAFARVRGLCDWIDDDRIIFQRKVTLHHLLVSPRLGTIGVAGERQVRPTARRAFQVLGAG